MLLVLDSQDVLQRPRSDEDSDGVELCRLQPPHSVGRHIQDAVLPLNTHTHTVTILPLWEWKRSLCECKGSLWESVDCHLLGHLSHTLHRRPVQVVVVLPRLDEAV